MQRKLRAATDRPCIDEDNGGNSVRCVKCTQRRQLTAAQWLKLLVWFGWFMWPVDPFLGAFFPPLSAFS